MNDDNRKLPNPEDPIEESTLDRAIDEARKPAANEGSFSDAKVQPVPKVAERAGPRHKLHPELSSRQELMGLIKELAAKLGRAPSFPEFTKATGLPLCRIQKKFGSFRAALHECGLEAEGAGYQISMAKLFAAWAGVARKLGKVPAIFDFERHTEHSRTPLRNRFHDWRKVPQGMLDYAMQAGLENEWGDVMDLLRKHCKEQLVNARLSKVTTNENSGPRILPDRPLCGEPLPVGPMAYAPRNEAGVLFLFGAMAEKLHFSMVWVGTEFPDCQGMREVEPGRWQYVKIEIEFESRNYRMHAHDEKGCDLVVCWVHNWKECPLEVIELKKVVAALADGTPTTETRRHGGTENSS